MCVIFIDKSCVVDHLKRPIYAFGGFHIAVVCYIAFSACKWSAKAKIPKFHPEGVSLPHQLHVTC